jgi:hypothetical protein
VGAGRAWHYVVPADAALARLERAAPEAAAWWRANAPERIGPEQTFEFPAAVCEELVRLAVGAGEVLVGTRPLRAARAKGFRSMRLRRAGEDRLVLRPTGLRLFALPWLIGGIVFTGMSISQALSAPQAQRPIAASFGAVLFLLPGVVFLASAVGCLVLPRTYVFDRAAGVLRVSRLGSRREWPLREVVAVQLVRQWGSGRGPRTTYQLNLVLVDDRPRRLCLSNDNYWEATRAAGAELAGFLGVPLLDEVSGTSSGGTDGAPGRA